MYSDVVLGQTLWIKHTEYPQLLQHLIFLRVMVLATVNWEKMLDIQHEMWHLLQMIAVLDRYHAVFAFI
jgi:hypothetical protein